MPVSVSPVTYSIAPLLQQVVVVCIARLVQPVRPSDSGSWYRFHILGFLNVQRRQRGHRPG